MSRHIFIPTMNGVADWQKLLADPKKHWRTGYSAKALAYCWENANGFPPEIALLFSQSNNPAFQHIELLLAFPEHKVIMPPRGGHPSQNDLFVLAKASDGQLITIMIEGKVSEHFGENLGKWNAKSSRGKTERLTFIKELLDLTGDLPKHIRYQFFHRTASAVIEAVHFNALNAAMIVHSFNQNDLWFDDYQNFLTLFSVHASEPGRLFFLKETHDIKLYSGWARGNEEFLRVN